MNGSLFKEVIYGKKRRNSKREMIYNMLTPPILRKRQIRDYTIDLSYRLFSFSGLHKSNPAPTWRYSLQYTRTHTLTPSPPLLPKHIRSNPLYVVLRTCT